MNRQLENRTSAAAALGVSVRTFQNMVDNPDMEYPRPIIIGKRAFFDVDERIEWIKKQKKASNRAA